MTVLADENGTVIIRSEMRGYRPYSLDGGVVKTISFYNDNGIIFTVERGWLEEIQEYNIHSDIKELVLPKHPAQRTKENLSRKENFYIRKKAKYSFDDPERHLFLYVDNANTKLEEVGTIAERSDDYHGKTLVMTYKNYKLSGNIVCRLGRSPIMKVLVSVEHVSNGHTKEYEKLVKLCQEHNINIDTYNLNKLFKYCKVTPRKEPIKEM